MLHCHSRFRRRETKLTTRRDSNVYFHVNGIFGRETVNRCHLINSRIGPFIRGRYIVQVEVMHVHGNSISTQVTLRRIYSVDRRQLAVQHDQVQHVRGVRYQPQAGKRNVTKTHNNLPPMLHQFRMQEALITNCPPRRLLISQSNL